MVARTTKLLAVLRALLLESIARPLLSRERVDFLCCLFLKKGAFGILGTEEGDTKAIQGLYPDYF